MDATRYRLPDGWSSPSVIADTVVADGLRLYRAGVSSRGPSREEIAGAAVDTESSPMDRGYFELLERVSTVEAIASPKAEYDLLLANGDRAGALRAHEVFPISDAPDQWRYARSNGVAIHLGWQRAAERARWELAERDRVLRAWHGYTHPIHVEFMTVGSPVERSECYEWTAHAFPDEERGFSHDLSVVGVFGFPRLAGVPLVMGYAARTSLDEACDAALREALQQLGFLWGEALSETFPESAPTATYHLEYYQWGSHARVLRNWLESGHCRYAKACDDHQGQGADDERVSYVDLTPAWLSPELRVAKAISSRATPLVFGQGPFARHLPAALRTHPIG